MMVGAGMTVSVTRTEHMAAGLRRQEAVTGNAAVARRLLALALRWLRHWLLRRRIARARWRAGPDLALDKVVRWRCSDVRIHPAGTAWQV